MGLSVVVALQSGCFMLRAPGNQAVPARPTTITAAAFAAPPEATPSDLTPPALVKAQGSQTASSQRDSVATARGAGEAGSGLGSSGQIGSSAQAPLIGPGQTAPPQQVVFVPATGRVVVDRMVGSINSEPVYAEYFLEPLNAQFAAEARIIKSAANRRELEAGESQWLSDASSRISRRLFDKTRDGLLLSEFYAGLSEQERFGVLGFIENVQAQLVAQNQGSAQIANRRILESDGLTLEEKVQDLTEQEIIREQLKRIFGNKIQVSYREVERFYNQNIDQYNPDPSAIYRVIRVRTSNEADIAAVQAALASGEDFAAVAAQYSIYNSDQGNIHGPFALPGGSAADVELWADAALDKATRELKLGETTNRVDAFNSAMWVRYETLDERSVSLYDAQKAIQDRIYQTRFRQRETEYFQDVLRNAQLKELDRMVRELVVYAYDKHIGDGVYADRLREEEQQLDANFAPFTSGGS